MPLRDLPKWSRRTSRRIELFIPPPPTADKAQAFHCHLATRNFFAWVFRRSMVGQTLGEALVGVMHSMKEFRFGVENDVEDLMGYLDEEGYLDMANQPNHALAMLHLAESFQMKELYTRAFAHAVGMSDSLLSSTEYQVCRSPSWPGVVTDSKIANGPQVSQSHSTCSIGNEQETDQVIRYASDIPRRRAFRSSLGYFIWRSGSPGEVSKFSPIILYDKVRILPTRIC